MSCWVNTWIFKDTSLSVTKLFSAFGYFAVCLQRNSNVLLKEHPEASWNWHMSLLWYHPGGLPAPLADKNARTQCFLVAHSPGKGVWGLEQSVHDINRRPAAAVFSQAGAPAPPWGLSYWRLSRLGFGPQPDSPVRPKGRQDCSFVKPPFVFFSLFSSLFCAYMSFHFGMRKK